MVLIFGGENYDTGRESGQAGSAAVQRPRRTLHQAADRLSGVHPEPIAARAPNRAGRGDVESALQGGSGGGQIGRLDRSAAQS